MVFKKVLSKILGTKNERELKRLQPIVEAINALEPKISKLTDNDLKAKTVEFKNKLSQGASLDEILVEAFAVVREVARRTVGMRPFDVQLMGGIVLHEGKIAEMKTGEGKTLVATMPLYLNALLGKGVHLVTVNDYLARRDAEWMGPIYKFLGLTVGVIQHDMSDYERKKAYQADITYGTNNEFGFDYLRDNMKFRLEDMVQRGHYYAIVDEVDSILIDEARTPLIISGPAEESVEKYLIANRIVPKLTRGEEIELGEGKKHITGDFLVDEKAHTVTLTDQGVEKVEKLLGIKNLYDIDNIELLHAINQALRAHHLFKKDVDYVVKNGQVIIVDEFTGRLMPGRRWSDGLHQAVEAKEGVKIQQENQTLATITFQNYFRMYEKLAGMTGTAATEEKEFQEIYGLDVVVIPTNKPMIRKDHNDVVFRTERAKWKAIVEEIKECHKRGQPVLVGTVSIEKSELLSKMLKKERIPHVVLNAKYHEKEAAIVAQAGRKGAVTIATNMAGRGTDIVLGGNPEGLAKTEADPEKEPEKYQELLEKYRNICSKEKEEVIKAGGLHIIGTERHESRRIDNQLRGRAGRQGDPGSSRFYVSMEDDLMRLFIPENLRNMVDDNEPVAWKIMSKNIERAQMQIEARNFEIRKNLLEYDDVMNKQREEVYRLRKEILEGKIGREYILKVAQEILNYILDTHCPPDTPRDQWKLSNLITDILAYFDINLHEHKIDFDALSRDDILKTIWNIIKDKYDEKVAKYGEEVISQFEKFILLETLDKAWKNHLLALDHLKEGIGLRGYGQKDPKNEYKRESFELFGEMKERFEDTIIKRVFRIAPPTQEEREQRVKELESLKKKVVLSAPSTQSTKQPLKKQKVGRNAPCPCGSGKKYKKCCGKNVAKVH